MFEFKKLCDEYEKLSPVEKGLLLTESSVKIMAKLGILSVPGIDPVESLAGFIIGSVLADGKIDEREYLLIYPALVKAFGSDFDYNSIKESFRNSNGKKVAAEYAQNLIRVLDFLNEDLKTDVIRLCLCVCSVDGKISFKEKRYVRKLFRA